MGETLGIISDIHANGPALQAVLDDMNADRLVCAGDIVGVLGFNAETIELVSNHCEHVVFGNHDARVRPDFPYVPEHPLSKDEHRVVTEQLQSDHTEYITSLAENVVTESVMMGHARPVYLREVGYPIHGFASGDYGTKPGSYTRYGPHLDGRIGIIGHTHESGHLHLDKFQGQSGTMVNPGSVGVPWHAPAEYATIELDTHDVTHHTVEYDYELVEEQLIQQETPPSSYNTTRLRK